MAVKCMNIFENKPVLKRAVVELFADTRAEVSPNMEIRDFPPKYTIEMGSIITTGDFNVGVMKSDGTWNWDQRAGSTFNGSLSFDGTIISGYEVTIKIPNGISKIDDNAFVSLAGLKEIKIPDTVTIIGDSAFENCTGLTTITIPASVVEIGDSAFEGCTELVIVYCEAETPPDIDTDTFSGVNATFIVPNEEALAAYKADTKWSNLTVVVDFIEKFDFTAGTTGIKGTVATLHGIGVAEGVYGLGFIGSNGYVSIPNVFRYDSSYFITVTQNMTKMFSDSNTYSLISFGTSSAPTEDDFTIAYDNNLGKWVVGTSNDRYVTNETSADFFKDSLIEVYIDENGLVYVYKDRVLTWVSGKTVSEDITTVFLGGYKSYYQMQISNLDIEYGDFGPQAKTIDFTPVISISDAKAGNALDYQCKITAVQSGTGDPSPTNIRSITGWTGANISVNGSTVSVSWQSESGTVYGGVLDVTTGTLTVTHTIETLDETDGWVYTNSRFRANRVPINAYAQGAANETYVVSMGNWLKYRAVSGSARLNDGECVWFASTNNLFVRADFCTTKAEFDTFIADNPLVLIAELAEPLTHTLTPTEIALVAGNNTIWADTGDSAMTYLAKKEASPQLASSSQGFGLMMMNSSPETIEETEDDFRNDGEEEIIEDIEIPQEKIIEEEKPSNDDER